MSVQISQHGLTEIRIVRGEKDDSLNGMVRVYGFIGEDAVIDLTLFGKDELRIPIKVSSNSSDEIVLNAELYNCLGDVVQEEE